MSECLSAHAVDCTVVIMMRYVSGNHKMLYESGKVGYNATLNLITSSWHTWHPLFPDQSILYFHTSIVNHSAATGTSAKPLDSQKNSLDLKKITRFKIFARKFVVLLEMI